MIKTIKDLGFSDYKEISDYQWLRISRRDDLSVKFYEKYYKHICWSCCSAEQHLSDDFIQAHKDMLNWDNILTCENGLSEAFIERYADKVNWNLISGYQTLSEPFIEKYKDKVSWFSVSKYQTLSEPFIEKYKDKVNLYYLLSNSKIHLSDKFIEKY